MQHNIQILRFFRFFSSILYASLFAWRPKLTKASANSKMFSSKMRPQEVKTTPIHEGGRLATLPSNQTPSFLAFGGFFASLCLSALLPREAQAAPCLRPQAHIQKMHLSVQLYPQKHSIEVTAKIDLCFAKATEYTELSLTQMATLQHLHAVDEQGRKQPLPHQRKLEHLRLQRPKMQEKTKTGEKAKPNASIQIELRYRILFFAEKNYLYRQILCQIAEGDTYFLYGWYPSFSAFADPIRGELLVSEPFPYTLEIEAPADERPLSTGILLEKTPRPHQRALWRYAPSQMKEAAILLLSGRYQRILIPAKDTQARKQPTETEKKATQTEKKTQSGDVIFYLQAGEERKNLRKIAELIQRASAYYEGLWGLPWSSEAVPGGVSAGALRRHWRVATFGGSGARGYPMMLLLARNQHYLDQPLRSRQDRMYELRQIFLHEVAHTWWGNAFTGVRLGSTWLNEGLANYASLKALGALYGKAVMKEAYQRHLRFFLESEVSGDLMAPSGLDHMIERTAYTKGALVFFALEDKLGEGAFLKALRVFFERYRGGFADAKAFQRSLERSSGVALGDFFRWVIRGDDPPWVRIQKKLLQPRGKGTQVELTLLNDSPAPAWPTLRFLGQDRHHDLKIALTQGTKSLRLTLPFRVRQVLLDPEGRLFHGFRAAYWLKRADEARKSKQFQRAEAIFLRLLRHAPRLHQASYSYGLLQETRGDHNAALRLYKQATLPPPNALSPAWVKLWARLRLARLFIRLQRHPEAYALLHALQKTKEDPYHLQEEVSETLARWDAKRQRFRPAQP